MFDGHGNIGNQNARKVDDKSESHLNMRCLTVNKDEWKLARESAGFKNLSEWVVSILNEAAEEELYK